MQHLGAGQIAELLLLHIGHRQAHAFHLYGIMPWVIAVYTYTP